MVVIVEFIVVTFEEGDTVEIVVVVIIADVVADTVAAAAAVATSLTTGDNVRFFRSSFFGCCSLSARFRPLKKWEEGSGDVSFFITDDNVVDLVFCLAGETAEFILSGGNTVLASSASSSKAYGSAETQRRRWQQQRRRWR